MRGNRLCIIISGQPHAGSNFCGSYCICVFNLISGKSFFALLFLFEVPPLVLSTQRLLPLDFEISNLLNFTLSGDLLRSCTLCS